MRVLPLVLSLAIATLVVASLLLADAVAALPDAGATPAVVGSPDVASDAVLVVIDADHRVAAGEAWFEALRTRASILHVGRDYLIARTDDATLEALGAVLPATTILDRGAIEGTTYLGVELVDANGRTDAARLGTVLFARDRHLVVRQDGPVPDDFRLEGIEGIVPLRALRLAPPVAVPAAPSFAAPDAARQDVVAEIVAAVTDLDYQAVIGDLEGFASRNARGTGYWNAATYAHDRFEFFGIPAEILEFEADPWWGDPFTCWNVVAEMTGVLHPEQIYVICGHLDSTAGNPSIPETVAPGADDNGSGSAAVLEAARILSTYVLDRTVRFICFGAEEQGLCGSAVYAAAAAGAGDQILGVLNLDMLLYGPPGHETIKIRYNSPSQPLAEAFDLAAATHVPELDVLLSYSPGSQGSDHYSFWQNGYAAVEGIEDYLSGNPYYHQTTDRLANYMAYFPFGTNCFRGALATLATLAGPHAATGVDEPDADRASASPVRLAITAVAPHPVIDRVRVTLSAPFGAPLSMMLYDVMGRELRRARIAAGSDSDHAVELGLGDLPAGIYLLRATDGWEAASRKLVVTR